MKKYIVKGVLILESDIIDSEYDLDAATAAIYEKHKFIIDKIIEWANKLDVCIMFGGSGDNNYLCDYAFDGLTKSYLKGLVSELKAMLKPEFPQIRENHQVMFESR